MSPRSLSPALLCCAGLLAALLGAGAAQGGTASASFTVRINLVQPGGGTVVNPVHDGPAFVERSSYCVSETLSEQANAQVRVVCRGGEFVSIEPAPNREFAGTHGAAHRFIRTAPAQEAPAIGSLPGRGNGATVTALQVFDVASGPEPLEMLVSF